MPPVSSDHKKLEIKQMFRDPAVSANRGSKKLQALPHTITTELPAHLEPSDEIKLWGFQTCDNKVSANKTFGAFNQTAMLKNHKLPQLTHTNSKHGDLELSNVYEDQEQRECTMDSEYENPGLRQVEDSSDAETEQ